MSDPAEHPAGSGAFATTRWTLILRSRGETAEARVALGELCEAYWQPVFEFIRRRGWSEDEARECTQEFFARVLARRDLEGADPGLGRFRSFLLGAVKHFLGDVWDRAMAAKRGGGRERVAWEETTASGEAYFAGDASKADLDFDHGWAVSLVNRAVDALSAEFAKSGRAADFSALNPWLLGEPADSPQSVVAARLGWTENAVRVAVHRLRRRFRERVRAEIRQTVGDDEAVQDEIRYLVQVLGRAGAGGGLGLSRETGRERG